MTDIAKYLSKKDVFNKFPPEILKVLADYSLTRKLSAGEHLCRQGEIWPYVLYLEEGKLNWSMLSSGGKAHQLFKIQAGEIFWAHSFFDDQPMPASLSANGSVMVTVWSRDTILPMLMKYPAAMWDIPKRLTGIMRDAREIIYGLAFQPVASRLAVYLLDNLTSPGQESIEREMTLEEMASVLATSPEVVCRLLYQFQTDGILKVTRTHITLENQAALKNLTTIL